MKICLVAGAVMMLAGCGSGDSAVDEGSAAIASDAPLKIVITQFPASYFGRWGMTEADCILGASDAKGLITVQGSLVKFYESTATMTRGLRETLHAVSGDFDVVGEGQKWQTHTRYRLTVDRKELTRQDSGTGEKFVYTRCND